MNLFKSIKSNLKEADLQSLFTIITDEARKHNNYAHLSAREIDSQDIKELTKDCKKRGKEIAPGKYVVDDYIYEIDSRAGITVKENTDAEYKVVPVKEGLDEAEDNPTREELLNKRLDKIIDKLGDPNTSDKEAKRLETERDKIVQYLDNIEKDKKDLKEADSISNNIEYATPNYTGGSIYVYTGKLKDGNYFMASDEDLDKYNKAFAVRIVNEDPDTAEDPDQDDIAWFPEWQEPRLVKDLEGKEAEEFTKQILRWVIANKPDGNYQISDMKGMLDFVEDKSSRIYN